MQSNFSAEYELVLYADAYHGTVNNIMLNWRNKFLSMYKSSYLLQFYTLVRDVGNLMPIWTICILATPCEHFVATAD
jgi:hypothetical protein